MALQANGAVTPLADKCIICEFTGLASSEADALNMLAGIDQVTVDDDAVIAAIAQDITDGVTPGVKSMTTV